MLYRTHKSLLLAASKISSLYVFDALCRAAKSQAVKNNITGDIFTQPGNAATFLLKAGGVVEGVFQDMVASGSSESKVRSILQSIMHSTCLHFSQSLRLRSSASQIFAGSIYPEMILLVEYELLRLRYTLICSLF